MIPRRDIGTSIHNTTLVAGVATLVVHIQVHMLNMCNMPLTRDTRGLCISMISHDRAMRCSALPEVGRMLTSNGHSCLSTSCSYKSSLRRI